jgi:hypothetical protein
MAIETLPRKPPADSYGRHDRNVVDVQSFARYSRVHDLTCNFATFDDIKECSVFATSQGNRRCQPRASGLSLLNSTVPHACSFAPETISPDLYPHYGIYCAKGGTWAFN